MARTFLIIFIVFVLVLAGIFFYFMQYVSSPNSDSPADVSFTIKKGEGVQVIADELEKQGLIKSAFMFGTYVFFDGSQSKFIAGDYLLKRNYAIKDVVRVLTSGQLANERIIKIIEGWTNNEIADYLEQQNVVAKASFSQIVNVSDSREIIPDKTYSFLSDKPANQGFEGYLFPDTYRVFKDATPSQIVEKMLDNFDKKLTPEMRLDIQTQNRTIYEIVSLASILEKEVRTDRDRKIAAGIFYTRLAQGHPLQSDATVNYVTGKSALQPSSEDIAVDNLYNTYKYNGLPPGPISNPSLSAIKAAIYPEESEYFYFLTKPDGSTVFSKTYDEHLANKRKYLQ